MKATILVFFFCLIFPFELSAVVPKEYVSDYLYLNKAIPNNKGKWNREATIVVDNLKGYQPGEPLDFSKYGGALTTNYQAKGYFYTKKIKGRWWFVDPDGHLMPLIGLNILKHEKDSFSPFVNNADWASNILPFLNKLGIYSGGGWTPKESLNKTGDYFNYIEPGLFTLEFYVELGLPRPDAAKDLAINPVFHPRWNSFVDAQVNNISERYNGDPRFVGFFSDNELRWNQDALIDCLESDDYNSDYAVNWVQSYRGNSDPVTLESITEEEINEFFKHYLESYYKPIYDSAKKYMPNHLYIGSRINQTVFLENEVFLRTYGKYTDVMSFNRYGKAAWSELTYRMDNIAKWGNKPWIVTEFYAKGSDLEYFDNVNGAGQIVETQKNRGEFYQNVTLSWLQHKSNAGWAWFGYRDPDYITDPTKSVSNSGLFDLFHSPHEELTKLVSQLNNQYIYLAEFFDGAEYNNSNEDTIFSDFSVENNIVEMNGSVAFNNESLGAISGWKWLFEGGTPSSSTEKNPTVRYEKPGVYSVELTASDDADSDTETKQHFITVIDPSQNQPPKIYLTYPNDLSKHYPGRRLLIETSVSDSDGYIKSVKFFVNDELIREDKTPNYSAYYTLESLGDFELKAVAIDDQGAKSEAVVNMKVVLDEELPTVSIRIPSNERQYLEGETINKVSAVGILGGSEISHVDFFVNGEYLSTDITADENGEYQHFGYVVGKGTYDLKAIITDVGENSSSSEVVRVFGKSLSNRPPSVEITKPQNTSELYEQELITIRAESVDLDGDINHLEFFVNGSSIGRVESAPFEMNYYIPEVGDYTIKVTATDNEGDIASTKMEITALAKKEPSFTVQFVELESGYQYSPGTLLSLLEAVVVDNNGDVITSDDYSIEFYRDGELIKIDESYKYTYQNIPIHYGVNTIQAIAKDPNGNESSTEIIIFGKTETNQPPSQVDIVSPRDGAVRTVGELIKLEALAIDSDSSIYKIEFFVNGERAGVAYSPESRILRWPVPLGNASITAVATDIEGDSTESIPVVITGIDGSSTVESSSGSNGGGIGIFTLIFIIVLSSVRYAVTTEHAR